MVSERMIYLFKVQGKACQNIFVRISKYDSVYLLIISYLYTLYTSSYVIYIFLYYYCVRLDFHIRFTIIIA